MQHVLRKTSSKFAVAVAVAVTLGLAVAGCSHNANSSPSSTSGKSSTVGTAPLAGRPKPVPNPKNKTVKIDMIGYSNNPFWNGVTAGIKSANAVLSKYHASVTFTVAGTAVDVPTINSALQASQVQGYDAVGFWIAGEGNCPVVKALSSAGMAVGAYNTLIPCVATSGGAIDYSQQQVAAGKLAAKEMIKATGNKAGSIGLIVSRFTSPGSQQRAQGFIDGLKGSNLTVIGHGVEANDSASSTYSASQSYIQSTPNLVGIYATGGGPYGAAQAVAAAGKNKTVKVIGYDIVAENIAAIKNGSMYGVIGQDAFGQGYNVAISLYNSVITGKPAKPVLQNAFSPFVDLSNLKAHDPSLNPVGKLGTS